MTYSILFVVLVIISYVIFTYNSIVSNINEIKKSWANVLTRIQQKVNTIPKLEELVKEHCKFESDTLEKMTELRTMINSVSDKEVNPKQLEEIEARSKDLISKIQVSVEDYPELQSQGLYKSLMAEISELEDHIASSITIYNHKVCTHNTCIQSFPENFVNAMFNKSTEVDSFKTDEAEKGVDFSPNL